MEQNILNELNTLRVSLKPRIEELEKKYQELFGGNFITQLSNMEWLMWYAKSTSTDSVLIPDKQLVIDIYGDVKGIINNVREIIDIVDHNLASFQENTIETIKELARLKLNEKEMNDYIHKLNSQIEFLKKNQEELMSMRPHV